MIGIDTNVLVRVCLEDDLKEANLAKKLLLHLTARKKLFVSSYALLEAAWVLKTKGKTRSDITEIILVLLDSPGVTLGQREVVTLALEHYRLGKADFGDYFILAEGVAHGSHHLASFDKTLCKEKNSCHHPEHFVIS